jgi:23S rRNA (guanosine2251-2'-O)-methyltransferase
VKTEILFGIHPVYEALKAGRRTFFEIYISREKEDDARLRKILSLSADVPLRRVTPVRLKQLTKSAGHQGVAAKVSHYPVLSLRHVLESTLADNTIPFFLLMDGIVDPHNMGAMVRTAACVGISGVIIPKNRSASPTPVVSKVSAGHLEHLPLIRITNMVDTVRRLKKSGIWVVGLEKEAPDSIFTSDLTGPVAIIIGGEERGIRPLVRKNCDILVSLPQADHTNSLNASIAGGVAMYEIFRQRGIQ